MENQNEKLVGIQFMDILKIISSNETLENQKIVYIYLINKLMDLEDEIIILKNEIKELTIPEPSFRECELCEGWGFFKEDEEQDVEEQQMCPGCYGEGIVECEEEDEDTQYYLNGFRLPNHPHFIYDKWKKEQEDMKWYNDCVKEDCNEKPKDEKDLPF